MNPRLKVLKEWVEYLKTLSPEGFNMRNYETCVLGNCDKLYPNSQKGDLENIEKKVGVRFGSQEYYFLFSANWKGPEAEIQLEQAIKRMEIFIENQDINNYWPKEDYTAIF